MALIVNGWLSSLCDYLSCVAFLCIFVMSNYTVHRRQSWKTDSVINKVALIYSGWAAENMKQWQADKEEEKQFTVWETVYGMVILKQFMTTARSGDQKRRIIFYTYISVRVMSVSVQWCDSLILTINKHQIWVSNSRL